MKKAKQDSGKKAERKPRYKDYSQDEIPQSCYCDQAIHSSHLGGGRHFLAAFTPFGIERMEHGFVECIFACRTQAELEGMRTLVTNNPHFHKRIKRKLLAKCDIIDVPAHDRYRDWKDYKASWWPMRLTQQGIREIDAAFGNRIRACKPGDDVSALRAEIEGNEHLHKEVKENLLDNLVSYVSVEAEAGVT